MVSQYLVLNSASKTGVTGAAAGGDARSSRTVLGYLGTVVRGLVVAVRRVSTWARTRKDARSHGRGRVSIRFSAGQARGVP